MTRNEYHNLNEFNQALHLEDCIVNAIGYEELAKALLKALAIDEIIDNLEYIARVMDIEIYEEV